MASDRRGSAGNVIAAVCSFFFPGLGQLVQGRLLAALLFLLMWLILSGITFLTAGLIPVFVIAHLWACIDAAVWRGPR